MLAIGLMSGTSLDGIDAALIETDGEAEVRRLAFRDQPYTNAERAVLTAATSVALTMERPGETPEIASAAALITRRHADAVRALLDQARVAGGEVGVIGFHGQTVAHRPDRRWTWQIGDGAQLAQETGITTVSDFRSADVAAGGQGAPLIPVYHRALAAGLERPLAIVNLGGVANVTFIGSDGELIAFDTGPANGLIDSWVESHTGMRFDEDGRLAAAGHIARPVLTAMLDHPYFDAAPPKSLDRSDFTIRPVSGLSIEDGAATLTAFTAEAVARSLRHLPGRPRRMLVAGGGRRNPAMLAMIAERTGLAIEPVDAMGWNGDAIEAEGFAYLAVRCLKTLAISFPGTTGVAAAMAGGRIDAVEGMSATAR